MNLYVIACFNGTMQACENLYDQSPLGSAHETYGDTRAGRRPAVIVPVLRGRLHRHRRSAGIADHDFDVANFGGDLGDHRPTGAAGSATSPCLDRRKPRMIKRLIGAMVVVLCLGRATVSAAAPPTTTPLAAPVPAPAPTQQPTGLGSNARMGLLAIACFNGTMQACDDLYDESPVGSDYETFADTCAGRQPAGTGRYCAEVFTDAVVEQTTPTTTVPPTTSVINSTTAGAPVPPVPSTVPGLVATSVSPTTTGSVATSDAGLNEDLAAAVGMLSSMTMDGTILPEAEPACFDAAVARFDDDISPAAEQLSTNPLAWSSIPREMRFPIISAYVGCTDIEAVINLLAIGLINSLEASPCVAAAWTGLLSAELIAASLAYGTGLDNLPPDVVTQLVDGAVPCVDNQPWWIDDIAFELERQYDFSPEQATCVATNFVHTLGIARAVERRVLTIPMLTLPDADLKAIDLAGCGVTVTLPPLTGGDVGDCLAGMFSEPEPTMVSCDAPHNAEVLANIKLTDLPAWPGINLVDDQARALCVGAVKAAAPNRDDIGVTWSVPSRQAWERGSRTVTCIIGPIDGSNWTAPSGLTPTSPTTTVAG